MSKEKETHYDPEVKMDLSRYTSSPFERLKQRGEQDPNFQKILIAGVFGGSKAFYYAVGFPPEVLKVNKQSFPGEITYPELAKKIWQERGVSGFFKGAVYLHLGKYYEL